ncbi:MAG: FAD-dependent thymidylate synthase [Dehalococcoidia bacterium]
MVEHFDPKEQAIIAPFFTNLDKDVFGLVNLPEVVKGTLFSRYSRSPKTLRRVLLDEFIHTPEMGFEEIVGSTPTASADSVIAIEKAERFYDRVLVGYGDDSVAELAGTHIACENVSSLAGDYLTDSRIGISPLEKSARYILFDEKINGDYLYYKDPGIMGSEFGPGYVGLMDKLFDSYTRWIEQALDYVRDRTPREEGTSERAYASATRAKACDIMKNILPASRLTNVGLYGNGRAYEYMLNKLYSSELAETRSLAGAMHGELRKLIPSFVKRAEPSEYITQVRQSVATALPKHQVAIDSQERMALVDFDAEAELKTVATILFPFSNHSLAGLLDTVKNLDDAEKRRIIQSYVGSRRNRRDKPGRAFEHAYYTFEFVGSYGVYRDLHRHRQLTQDKQRLTANLGYDLPEEFYDLGLASECDHLMGEVTDFYNRLSAVMPFEAQYAVPRMFRMRWYMTLNLREAHHIVELRSGRQGHPDYRKIAQEMYRMIHNVHPMLAESILVDMNDYTLARIESERRQDEKREQLQQRS